MEAVWGAVLSFLFVLATLSGYNATGPSTSEQKEQLEKQQKELKEQLEKDQKEQKEQLEKQQKEKSEKKEKSNKSSSAKAAKKKAEYCIKDCPESWRLRP
jgi:cell division protein FtsN